MTKAVILINSDTSYLEQKLSVLNYTTYAIDQFRHKNIHKLKNVEFIDKFLDDVLSKHDNAYLVYGSGLEGNNNIYELLTEKLEVKGNKLNIYDVASYNSDAILIMDRPGEKISAKLLKKAAFIDNKHKITIFDQKDAEDVDFYAITETLNQVISDITSK